MQQEHTNEAEPQTLSDIREKGKRLESLMNLSNIIRDKERLAPIPFNDFLFMASDDPWHVFRDIFQVFHDMVSHYVDDSPAGNIQSTGLGDYDLSPLFVNGCDNPFFADKLFSHRFMNMAKALRKGAQNNRIYFFEGPPGSGKSTFLNNLLQKLEEYTKMTQGAMYKTTWYIEPQKLGSYERFDKRLDKLVHEIDDVELSKQLSSDDFRKNLYPNNVLEISCPNHDHPILQLPLELRHNFLEELIPDRDFKERLFNSTNFKWVLKDKPCSICSSIYNALLDLTDNPMEVFQMVRVRHVRYDRQFGEGVSIFNPGDPILREALGNNQLQEMINRLFRTNEIRFVYSYLARTNNGVLALMDIKEQNIERLMSLHSVISDGVHKVGLFEERIKTLFLGLVNPEDKKHYENLKSFQDRIIQVNIPYVLDYNTEVAIYKNKFGKKIKNRFLPRILENFAKIVVATRLNKDSNALKNWLQKPYLYNKYLDKDKLLLKMELYAGNLPAWITEEDLKRYDEETRKKVVAESETEGQKGFSGRTSLNIFNSFYNKYSQKDNLITMAMVEDFFMPKDKPMDPQIPTGFIESLIDLYDYNVLQEVKESIYYYNEKQISHDIQNYLFSLNFEENETKLNPYTGDKITITEDYMKNFEAIFIGTVSTKQQRHAFRRDVHHEYISHTMAVEMSLQNTPLTRTTQFKSLFTKYTKNLKENSMAPYVGNENFRRAIIDFGTVKFNNYDDRMKRDVKLLIYNLRSKFKYTKDGAKEVSMYVIDRKLASKY